MHPNRIRSLFAATAIALLVPSLAFAESETETKNEAPAVKREKKDKAQFPMTGDAFTARVDARLKKAETRLTEHLAKAKVSDKVKKEIRAEFARGSAKIREVASKAAADGTVTKEEAKDVREVSRKLRREMHRHFKKDGGKGKGKGKGKRASR